LHLLKEKNFSIACILMFMLGFVLYGSTALLPLFMQKLLGYSATRSGMAISPGGFITMFMFPIVGMLLQKVQARWIAMVGFILVSASLFIMAGFTLTIDFGTAVWARCVQASGLALLFLPINTMAFTFLPREKNNAASGLINLARNQGGGFGIAFVATMLARRAQFHQNVLSSHLTPFDLDVQARLESMRQYFMGQGYDVVQSVQMAHGSLYGMLSKQAAMLAYLDDFKVLAIGILCMIPLLFLMKAAKPVKGGEMAAH
jgi:DHA2 family multidrug resistance protein